MRIGAIIKEKRLMKGLTQEQLVDFLGVSAPAVSKWEKSASYPDITLLPPLARLLDTDLNNLLSFHEELTRQEIALFLNEITSQGLTQGIPYAFEMAMDKIHEYPSCDSLLLNTALTLEGLLTMGPEQEPDCSYMSKIENLYEQAAKSSDPGICHQAQAMLISRYIERKEYERAEKLLSELPDATMFDKKHIQANMYMSQERWSDAAAIIEQKILSESGNLISALMVLMEIAMKEGRSSDAEHIAATVEHASKLFDQWDYSACGTYFQLAIMEKDAEKCLAALKTMLPSLLSKWRIADTPLYRHISKNGKETNLGEMILPKILSDLENPDNQEYDFLRENPEFSTYIAEFRKKLA